MKVKAKIGHIKDSPYYGDYWIEEIEVSSIEKAKEELEYLIEEFNKTEFLRYGNKKTCRRLISFTKK